MDYIQNFYLWKNNDFFDSRTREELSQLNEKTDIQEIEDRFYKDLEFGTAGMRGKMGAGTNRMNIYTVGRATAGYACYLIENFSKNFCENYGVVIGYDTRNNSSLFAKITARVLSSYGIKVFITKSPRPIPELSYTIRKLKAIGGVMITASHNPKQYNGYKVYDENGCQLGIEASKRVTELIKNIKFYNQIDFMGNSNLIQEIDMTSEYVNVVLTQSKVNNLKIKSNLNIVYTPLHGTGNVPVVSVLERDGFTSVAVVREQADSDGDFPTVISPNPEDPRALELGIKLASKLGFDIVLGTDPDSDRVGVAVHSNGEYVLLNGNQIGALLIDFLLSRIDLSKLSKPAIIKSIVTSNLGAKIAEKYGVKVFETPTGFKFIGQRMTQFEKAKIQGDDSRNYTFIFGYEESYGFLSGTYARDKDAVVSSMLIAEMASLLKAENKTLIDRLNELYSEFGYFYDAQDNFILEGKEGVKTIKEKMDMLRYSISPFFDTEKVIDYLKPVKAEEGFGELPVLDVIKYELEDGSWVAIRPSGTEPKLKVYYSAVGRNEKEAKMLQQRLQLIIKTKLDL